VIDHDTRRIAHRGPDSYAGPLADVVRPVNALIAGLVVLAEDHSGRWAARHDQGALTKSLLREAYLEIGLTATPIEQLTGQPAERILARLACRVGAGTFRRLLLSLVPPATFRIVGRSTCQQSSPVQTGHSGRSRHAGQIQHASHLVGSKTYSGHAIFTRPKRVFTPGAREHDR